MSQPSAGRAAAPPRWALVRRTLKPAYALYYRALYARKFPGKQTLDGLVLALERRIARGDTPTDKAVWEAKYRAGDWAFMHDLHQVPRYAAIASLAHRLRPGGAILDVGCGEGVLQDHLLPLGYARYLGVDVSETAVAQAAAAGRVDDRTAFVTADGEHFTPDGVFDVIVFNECVHYFRDAASSISAYESFLVPGGVFIISTFRTPRGDAIMRDVLKHYDVLEELAISHRKGASTLCVLVPS
jgi:SAM-dependent methyltransferase